MASNSQIRLRESRECSFSDVQLVFWVLSNVPLLLCVLLSTIWAQVTTLLAKWFVVSRLVSWSI